MRFPEKNLWKRIKHQSKKKGLDFDLDLEDIYIPEVCPILGTPFVYGDMEYAASLDRIDPKKGYIKGNVQVISNLANRMKSNASAEHLKLFAEWVMRNG